MSLRTITPGRAEAELARGALMLVDVRSRDQWLRGHAAGAIHIPLRELPEHIERLEGRTLRIAFICRWGSRSAVAAELLTIRGRLVAYQVAGGFESWRLAGLPIEIPKPD